jgi:hypothetical protein
MIRSPNSASVPLLIRTVMASDPHGYGVSGDLNHHRRPVPMRLRCWRPYYFDRRKLQVVLENLFQCHAALLRA